MLNMTIRAHALKIGAAVLLTGTLATSGALTASAATHWVGAKDVWRMTSQANGRKFDIQFGYIGKKQAPAVYGCHSGTGGCYPVFAKWEIRFTRVSDGKVLFDRTTSNYKDEAIEALVNYQLKLHHYANRVPSSSWLTSKMTAVMKMTDEQAYKYSTTFPY
ncbi:hypothetical protein [Amnibacterium kyonggiense]|uniref:Uncharacterized protein n=1 Tax=Amnibacterium kyonggiense TaxID=595671 RepID=A0A4R7FGK6_9MICO|nr:hypothetical protein [Amnibacterium kyonggiense]TDS74512.1 hypothetical protein CLV52_3695 [Amnibacterium kyonggiense]